MLQLSKRQEKLLYYLQNKEVMTCKELANQLQVSMKTVRNEITNINSLSNDPLILSLKGKGYRLSSTAIIPMQQSETIDANARNLLILKKILSSEENNYFDLADEFFISESTLNNTIHTINKQIKKQYPDLQIQRKNNILFINSSEIEKRQLYTYFLMREIDEYNFDLEKYASYFNSFNISKLKDFVLEFNQTNAIQMRDFEVISFILHIATMLERISKGNRISHIEKYDIDAHSKKLSSLFNQGLKEKINFELSKNEEHYLAGLFAGKLITYNIERISEYQFFLNQMITDIKNQYNIDFQNDHEFFENLLVHLIGLDSRIQNNQFLNNPLVTDIKIHFPLVYDISVYIALKIQTFFNTKLIEDEIGYIALHLMCAVEKIHQQNHKKVVIVTPLGKTSSNFIESKLQTMTINIEVVAKLSIFDVNKINEYNPDLVISTIPIHTACDFKVYSCNTVITKKDLNAIYKIFMPNHKPNHSSFFDETLFFLNQEFTSKEEVIHFLCEENKKQNLCDDTYESLVLQREQLAPTAYGNLFAIPHPIERVAKDNKIAICTLKNPIDWANEKVHIVFLFCISPHSDKNFEEVFENLVSLLNDITKVKKLLRAKDFNSFIHILDT